MTLSHNNNPTQWNMSDPLWGRWDQHDDCEFTHTLDMNYIYVMRKDKTLMRWEIREMTGPRQPTAHSEWLNGADGNEYPEAWVGCLEDELMRIAKQMRNDGYSLR